MAEPTTVKTLRDGTIAIKDGAGSPLTYTVAYENGDFSGAFPKADRTVIRDRHAVGGLRKGADPIPTFSFSVHFRCFKDAAATIIDVIERTNAWSAATSTGGTGYEQFLCDVVVTKEGTDLGDSADHTLTMTKCLLTWEYSEGDPDSVSVSGEVYGTVTRTGQV